MIIAIIMISDCVHESESEFVFYRFKFFLLEKVDLKLFSNEK